MEILKGKGMCYNVNKGTWEGGRFEHDLWIKNLIGVDNNILLREKENWISFLGLNELIMIWWV